MGNVLRSDLPENPELLRLLDRAKQPKPDAVGECPYCHHALEREQVREPGLTAPRGLGAPRAVLLTFWKCTNELCALMFWRQPESGPKPLADDAIEH